MTRPRDDIRRVVEHDLRDICYNVGFNILRPAPHPDGKFDDTWFRTQAANKGMKSNFFRGAYCDYGSPWNYANQSKDGDANLVYTPNRKKGVRGDFCNIRVTNLRLNRVTKVVPGDADAIQSKNGYKSQSVMDDIDNPSDVPIPRSLSGSVSKTDTASLQVGAKVMVQYEYELQQTVKTPAVESQSTQKATVGLDSWIDRITTQSETHQTSDSLSYVVPPHCRMEVVKKQTVEDLHQSFWITGELQATLGVDSWCGFDFTFNRFEDLEDMVRGLRGGEFGFLGRWWADNPLSDDKALSIIHRPTRTIDVPVVAAGAITSKIAITLTPYPGYDPSLGSKMLDTFANVLVHNGADVEDPTVNDEHRTPNPDDDYGPGVQRDNKGPKGGARS